MVVSDIVPVAIILELHEQNGADYLDVVDYGNGLIGIVWVIIITGNNFE